MARDAGMSLLDFSELAERDSQVDRRLDQEMVKLARTRIQIVLEGRLTGWMLRNNEIPSLKVWLDASEDIRARRIVERDKVTFPCALEEMRHRERSEVLRYRALYGIDFKDLSAYDMVVDTDSRTPSEIVALIIDRLKNQGLL